MRILSRLRWNSNGPRRHERGEAKTFPKTSNRSSPKTRSTHRQHFAITTAQWWTKVLNGIFMVMISSKLRRRWILKIEATVMQIVFGTALVLTMTLGCEVPGVVHPVLPSAPRLLIETIQSRYSSLEMRSLMTKPPHPQPLSPKWGGGSQFGLARRFANRGTSRQSG